MTTLPKAEARAPTKADLWPAVAVTVPLSGGKPGRCVNAPGPERHVRPRLMDCAPERIRSTLRAIDPTKPAYTPGAVADFSIRAPKPRFVAVRGVRQSAQLPPALLAANAEDRRSA